MKPDDETKAPSRGAAPSAPEKAEEAPVLRKRTPGEEDAVALQREADTRKMEEDQADETIPGGAYVVDGVWVDAEGKPLKQDRDAKEATAAKE